MEKIVQSGKTGLLEIRGVGEASLKKIEKALSEKGISLNSPGSVDKPVTAAVGETAAEGNRVKSLAETKRERRFFRRQRAGSETPKEGGAAASQTLESEAIEKQKNAVKYLQESVDNAKAELKNARLVRMKGIFSRTFYGAGHAIRWTAVPGLYIAGGLVQAALAGNAFVLLFDRTEDLYDLSEQYTEDITAIVNEAALGR